MQLLNAQPIFGGLSSANKGSLRSARFSYRGRLLSADFFARGRLRRETF
jgi:hypothetical protein